MGVFGCFLLGKYVEKTGTARSISGRRRFMKEAELSRRDFIRGSSASGGQNARWLLSSIYSTRADTN
jgi:hypothetical protein